MGYYKYRIRDLVTNSVLSFFYTEEAARERVELYEIIDRREGMYYPDTYKIEAL